MSEFKRSVKDDGLFFDEWLKDDSMLNQSNPVDLAVTIAKYMANSGEYDTYVGTRKGLVCYDCVTESNSISYNTQVNLPDVKPNNWKMGESVQYKNE